jgi:hypothetical protein
LEVIKKDSRIAVREYIRQGSNKKIPALLHLVSCAWEIKQGA